VKLRCRLGEIRGKRSLRELEAASGVNRATLSQIENGRLLPPDKHLVAIETAYGAPVHEWYSPRLLLEIQAEDGDE
jgi:transcriptional regulator with XRE-family HTH domain